MQISINPKIKRFAIIRKQSQQLVEPLHPEDFVVQPVADVSPPKWHLAHSTWFFEQFILIPFARNYQIYDPDFSFLFNSYYEAVGKRVLRANRGNLTRPGVEQIMKYREYVDQAMISFLESSELSKEIEDLLVLGLNHEQQHQELLVTDIKYILGHNPLFPEYNRLDKIEKQPDVSAFGFLEVEEGQYGIGYSGDEFHFDNEKGYHQVFLHGFRCMDRLITNREYLEFIDDNGYGDFRHWLMEGWEWVKENQVKAPLYWHQIDGEWHYYTMQGFRKIELNEPVCHISYYEADAFASWKKMRLLTEFEWEVASRLYNSTISGSGNFADKGYFHPEVRKSSENQFFGDLWEWTASAYLPYPFFQKAPGAIGEYNGKFMINQKVLRGGSCATPFDHIRPTYRNFFHPHLRWQFTGIRLAEYI